MSLSSLLEISVNAPYVHSYNSSFLFQISFIILSSRSSFKVSSYHYTLLGNLSLPTAFLGDSDLMPYPTSLAFITLLFFTYTTSLFIVKFVYNFVTSFFQTIFEMLSTLFHSYALTCFITFFLSININCIPKFRRNFCLKKKIIIINSFIFSLLITYT